MLVIISGPSGVGKDTIIEALRRRPHDPELTYVVTCTTRAPRPGEVEGSSYHFMSQVAFTELRDAGELLESAEVHGHWYGTPRRQVLDALQAGRDVILKIDVQGAAAVKAQPRTPCSSSSSRRRSRRSSGASVRGRPRLRMSWRSASGTPPSSWPAPEDYDHVVVVNETGEVAQDRGRHRCHPRWRACSPSTAQGPTPTASMFEPSTVEVAVDAVGAAGGRTYTYTVPDRLVGLAAGEAVIVEFGRRQALGIVLGSVAAPDGVTTDLKPILERVRSEGPLLPPLQLALTRVIARHYLAPAAMVVRAALPPGDARASGVRRPGRLGRRRVDDLGRSPVELHDGAERRRCRAPGAGRRAGPAGVAVARLTGARDRAATIRRLRALGAAGAIDLAWELRPPSVHRRYVRLVRLTDAGRAARGLDRPAGGRPLGHRQQAAIAMLADDQRPAVPAPEISARFGGGAVTGLAARGLVELEATVADRVPYADRDRHAPAMPAGSALNADQALATSAIVRAVQARSASTFLLDGVTAAARRRSTWRP